MNDLQKPEYVLQPNVISQAIYSLSTNARRLIAMAMSLIPPDAKEPGDYRVEFTVEDFLGTLGLKHGSKTARVILSAVRECLDSHVEIFLPDGRWKGWTWFTESSLLFEEEHEDEDGKKIINLIEANSHNVPDYVPVFWDNIVMEFNPKLGEVLKQFKKAYAKIDLANFGKLQSKYAIRFYELALSYAGFAGRDGNRRGEWYFEMSLADLRALFAIAKSKYKLTNDFRKKVIDQPIEEINAAGLGLRIEPDYKRRGKRLMGARFNCRQISREDSLPAQPATEDGKEDEAIISAFPDEYEALYAIAYKKISGESLFKGPASFIEGAAKAEAVKQLRETHPDFLKGTPLPKSLQNA